MGDDELSCDIGKYQQQICARGRIGVIFVGKDFPGTKAFIDNIAKAHEEGYFGEMELGVIPVDSEQCDNLAEAEKVSVLPTVLVYNNCKKIGEVTPTDEDARAGYKKAIEKLIDLSED